MRLLRGVEDGEEELKEADEGPDGPDETAAPASQRLTGRHPRYRRRSVDRDQETQRRVVRKYGDTPRVKEEGEG